MVIPPFRDFKVFNKELNLEAIRQEWVLEPVIITMPADDNTSLSTDNLILTGVDLTYTGDSLLDYIIKLDDVDIFGENNVTLVDLLGSQIANLWVLGYLPVGVHTVSFSVKRSNTTIWNHTKSFTITINS